MTSIYCPHCLRYTELSIAQVPFRHTYGKGFTDAIWAPSENVEWWIGICNACSVPSLVLGNGKLVYPTPRPSPTDPNIPPELAEDLNEAKLCFATGCFRACAAMARRCVQNACQKKGAKKRDLVKQINELTAAGVITKDVEEWATVVRWIGNDAAHPKEDDVTKDDAEDVLHLAEQFLHVIFVTPARAKSRRQERKK